MTHTARLQPLTKLAALRMPLEQLDPRSIAIESAAAEPLGS